jgi:hypothetical protein
MDLADPLYERFIGLRACRRWSIPPGVIARARHAQHPAQQPDCVLSGLVGDELAAAHRVALSRAKNTAAFFRISRSSRRSAFSRRKRASSARSSVTNPGRRPVSISAWRSQRRMVSGSTPKSSATWRGDRPLVRANAMARPELG